MKNIALTGFSTTGKSCVAREVAKRIQWDMIDIDDEIVKFRGKTISEIFSEDGESQFRKFEREILQGACLRKNVVISTGGGIILDPENVKLLHETCVVIGLEARVDTIHNRLLHDSTNSIKAVRRPLLEGKEPLQRIIDLKSNRQRYYSDVDWTVHTDYLSIEEVASEVIKGYSYASRSVKNNTQWLEKDIVCMVETSLKSYPVFVGWGLLDTLGQKVTKAGKFNKAVVISDRNVFTIYGEKILKSLERSGLEVCCYSIPPGELSKTINKAIEIFDFLIENKIARDNIIIALGGGVIGDLAGFVAATYLRGIAWVQVPTSLIAIVDASIGGKVAVDHINGKNLIGAFYHPHFVLSDVQTLTTLPERELISGWAEVIKHGLIFDSDYFELIEENVDNLQHLIPEITSTIISRSACIKSQVVSADERDTAGKRIILNYGHTIAHAIETASNYGSFLHGEAVSIGMMAAAKLSNRLGLLDMESVQRQYSILRRFGLPVDCTGVKLDEVIANLEVDKKMRDKSIQWVLLKRIGEAITCTDVTNAHILNVLEEVIRT